MRAGERTVKFRTSAHFGLYLDTEAATFTCGDYPSDLSFFPIAADNHSFSKTLEDIESPKFELFQNSAYLNQLAKLSRVHLTPRGAPSVAEYIPNCSTETTSAPGT